jgi:hypothetical protein
MQQIPLLPLFPEIASIQNPKREGVSDPRNIVEFMVSRAIGSIVIPNYQ